MQNLYFQYVMFPLKAVQKEREEKLVELLKDRLHQYVQGNKQDFIRHAEEEVARLSNAGHWLFGSIFPCVHFQLRLLIKISNLGLLGFYTIF